jgi:heme A synthase
MPADQRHPRDWSTPPPRAAAESILAILSAAVVSALVGLLALLLGLDILGSSVLAVGALIAVTCLLLLLQPGRRG